jgi:hypothetical protein
MSGPSEKCANRKRNPSHSEESHASSDFAGWPRATRRSGHGRHHDCHPGRLCRRPAHHRAQRVTRDIATVSTDSTYITFDINHEGEFYPNGWGGVSGTYTCSRNLGEWFTVIATLDQYRRDGALSSSISYNYSCAQQGRPVDLFFAPVTGGIGFKRGKATLTILVSDGAPGVVHNTVTQTVKLVDFQ